jgi:hypothetical protein
LLAGHAEEPSMALVLGIPASHGPANKTPALKPHAHWRDRTFRGVRSKYSCDPPATLRVVCVEFDVAQSVR